MTANERAAWERLLANAVRKRSYRAALVQNCQRALARTRAANKPARARRVECWLQRAQRELDESDAILAANALLLRCHGQES